MKGYIIGFIDRGLRACGFGPLVLAVIYFILNKCGVIDTISVDRMVTETVTVTALAFIAGGINVIYKIENLPISFAVLIHAIILYFDYTVIYLLNGWIKFSIIPFLTFTVCFASGYAIIWFIIYLATKKRTDMLNKKLSQLQSRDR